MRSVLFPHYRPSGAGFCKALAFSEPLRAAGESHRWQQWFWLAEAYANTGDTARALESLDSARIRLQAADEPGQIDSMEVALRGFENANALQNPAPDGR